MSKDQKNCSICGCEFEPDDGILGTFGMIPVAFCPICKVGIRDIADIYWGLAGQDDE